MEKEIMKKNLLLSVVGIGLQSAGSICLLAAVVNMGKEIKTQIKKTVLHELSKQLSEK